jgi:arabinose-5-phosphate isomerase
LQLLAGRMGDSFDRAVDMIEGMPLGGRVVLTGVGKSGHVARKVAASMSSTGTCAFFMHATEALHGDLGSVRQGDVCIAISYSGETPETLAALRGFKKLSAGSIAITSDPESTLGRQCDVCLAMGSITELDHNK